MTIRTKLIVASIVLVGAVAYLAAAGMKSGWVYYLEVDRFVSDTQYRTQRVRLHGKVDEADFAVKPGSLTANFKLLGHTQKLPVVYHGQIPDQFQAGTRSGRRRSLRSSRRLPSRCAAHQVLQQIRRCQFPTRQGEAMNSLLGNLSLSLTVLLAALAVVLAIASAKLQINGLLRVSRWLVASVFAMFTVASAALISALLKSDFTIQYVAHYTERALPFGYKLAAFWAGQDGSLLLWAWMLSAMCVIYLFARRNDRGAEAAATVATLAMVCGFFAILMLLAANPFKLGEEIPADGRGLNPMLQDPGMIAHPPMLFLGYAGFTIPFAALVGAMVANRRDSEWLGHIRRWAVASWLMLSIGILLGAQWAYVELGWGGYWAWDPVENASLLPWLTGTALIHSIMVQQHRGMLKLWNAVLTAGTFVLCIFGTYLTRSGVVSSVHSFGESLVGTLFLAFLVVTILFSGVLLIVRRGLLKSEHNLENLLGREGMFLATNVLLVGMTLVTLFGTIFPVISRTLSDHEVTVGPNFYNKVIAPLALLLAGLMAVGPLLNYGAEASKRLIRGLAIPAIVACVIATFAWTRGLHNTWALLAIAIGSLAIGNVLIDLGKSVAIRAHAHSENPITAPFACSTPTIVATAGRSFTSASCSSSAE
jgi:cytochrome c-type biogenesis protein CcmF